MQCERLIKQIKSWYIHVSNETMAPARMISFIETHAEECHICQADPDLQKEIKKITELILPESKIPKAVRLKQEQAEMEKNAAAEYEESSSESNETDDEIDGQDGENDENDEDGENDEEYTSDDLHN